MQHSMEATWHDLKMLLRWRIRCWRTVLLPPSLPSLRISPVKTSSTDSLRSCLKGIKVCCNSNEITLIRRLLERLSTLQLHARLPMIGSVSGKHRSPIRGSSLEFAEYRKYVPGDDPRRLDWRAYARNDRYYIKEFEADTNLRMCLVVDTSGSMNFAYNGVRVNWTMPGVSLGL